MRLPNLLELLDKRSVGACREVDLHALGVEPRRLDRSARWLTAAAALAVPQDGRRERMERTGLFVGATRMPAESTRRCTESIRLRGVAGTSASAFARMSVNAPAGACSQALGLLGPTSTVSIGEGSGLLALALAAEWLSRREDASSIVAGGVDELSGGADETEGAACLALKRVDATEPSSLVVAGWGIAGPHAAEEAAASAMGKRSFVDAVFVDGEASLRRWLAPDAALGIVDAGRFWGSAQGTRTSVMAAVAAAHLSAGHARSILLVASRGAASVALLLERT
jgi:hypothetical protein